MSVKPGAARILVVDDDHQMLDFLSEQLTSRGFAVETAASGGEAIDLVRGSYFDLVICDLQMPIIDGIACMEAIMNLNPPLHVFMISGEATVDKAVSAMKKGAYDFIQKPIRMEDLLFRIEKALLRNQLDAMEQVYKKSRPTSSNLSMQELLNSAINIIARFFRADQACWMTAKKQMLEIIGAYGLANEAARCKMLLLADKTVHEPTKAKQPHLENSAMLIPLLKDGDLEAVLVLVRQHLSEKFSLSELREATYFAGQILQTLG